MREQGEVEQDISSTNSLASTGGLEIGVGGNNLNEILESAVMRVKEIAAPRINRLEEEGGQVETSERGERQVPLREMMDQGNGSVPVPPMVHWVKGVHVDPSILGSMSLSHGRRLPFISQDRVEQQMREIEDVPVSAGISSNGESNGELEEKTPRRTVREHAAFWENLSQEQGGALVSKINMQEEVEEGDEGFGSEMDVPIS